MCASARRSRWAVETPGLSSLSTSARTSATILPARRIRSISARDFLVTNGPALLVVRHGGGHAFRDTVDVLRPIHGPQDPTGAVVIEDLLEAGQLHLEARPDGLGLVVFALHQR